jgi:hypothetical protein
MFTLLPVQNDFRVMYLEPHLPTLVSKTCTRKMTKPNRFFMFHYELYRINSLPSAIRRTHARGCGKATESRRPIRPYA